MTSPIKNPTREAILLTKLWQQAGPGTYPIDLGVLIEGAINGKLGGERLAISYRDLNSIEGTLVRDRSDSKLWHIIVSADPRKRARTRFTLAHELGHFMCHRHLKPEFLDSNDSINDYKSPIELDANLFAAWILMPANLVRAEFELERWNVSTLVAMRDRFQSSMQACARRLLDLTTKPRAFVVSRDGMILWCTKSKTAPYMSSYLMGDELPANSCALRCYETQIAEPPSAAKNTAWNDDWLARESHYLDTIGEGYQYTCIEFEKNSYTSRDEV